MRLRRRQYIAHRNPHLAISSVKTHNTSLASIVENHLFPPTRSVRPGSTIALMPTSTGDRTCPPSPAESSNIRVALPRRLFAPVCTKFSTNLSCEMRAYTSRCNPNTPNQDMLAATTQASPLSRIMPPFIAGIKIASGPTVSLPLPSLPSLLGGTYRRGHTRIRVRS